MNSIKIVRLYSGEDIIATVEELVKDEFLFSEPMFFEVDSRSSKTHILMSHYLPIQLVAKNEVVINKKDIQFMTNPTEEFLEYYSNSVEKLKNLFSLRDEVDQVVDDELPSEEMLEMIMKAFGNLDSDGMTKH